METTTVTLTPEHYWKAKSFELERSILEQNINQAIKTFEARLTKAFGQAGLDSRQRYEFNDDTLTATPLNFQHPQPQIDKAFGPDSQRAENVLDFPIEREYNGN